MKFATLLVIVLANNGYWFSGQPGSINLRSAVKGGLPDADIFWELKIKDVLLDRGHLAFPAGDKPIHLNLTIPPTRVRVEMHWTYRIVARTGKKELETGDVPLNVFPDDLTQGMARRVGNKKIIIWDRAQGLPQFFDAARVPYFRIGPSGSWEGADAAVVLVGPDMVDDSLFEQSPLAGLAKSGASVMIFRQTRPGRLMEYPLTLRNTPARLDWQVDHPLLKDFLPQDLHSWIVDVPTLKVIELPADEPVSVIGSYRREVPGDQPAPVDALLVSKSVGKGRVVLCQVLLGDWKSDPRSQILLNNALDCLLSRPEPTPRPSERPAKRAAETPALVPTIQINGDQP